MTMLQRTYDSIDRIGQQTDHGFAVLFAWKGLSCVARPAISAFQARCVRVHVLCKGT